MILPKLFKEILTLGLLLGFSTGSLTTSAYHLKQRQEERKVMLECQKAWEKYYALNQNTKPIQFNLANQVDKKVKLKAITNKLNHHGLEIDRESLAFWINEISNQGLGMATGKLQELIPWTRPLASLTKFSAARQLARESEQQKVYYSEVLPKCRKIKDWTKEMNHLVKKSK